ncbi:MAG: TRAP transporter large permease [Desulfobacteraceae bacterium]|nr:MAG: TRAP transporter large permease [Desulfobacteraceae bacterium]
MLVGSIGILAFVVLVAIGIPIALSLLLVGLTGLLFLVGLDPTLATSAPMFYNYISKYEFSVIPMFILMGNIGFYSGLFGEVFEVARKWLGRLPAGLAVSVVGAQTLFGACSGSTIAACAVIGKSAFPVMKNAGYPHTLSTGVIAGSGTLAALIPPSVTMCIYGLLVDESIGKLLIAGILPGLLTAGIYVVMLMIQSRKVPKDSAVFTIREKLYAIRFLWVVFILVLAIIGGIYAGLCTPTEAGAFGAFVVFMLSLMAGRVNGGMIWKSVRSTITTTGTVLIIIVAAVLFSRFLTLSGFSRGITEWVAVLEVPRVFIYGIIVVIYLFLGCFVGATGMMVMTLPTFYPLVMKLGYDPIWFGIQVVILCELAVETPPVGVNLYATQSITGGVPITTVIRGTMPFVMRDLMALGVIYLFPQIATYLPSLM